MADDNSPAVNRRKEIRYTNKNRAQYDDIIRRIDHTGFVLRQFSVSFSQSLMYFHIIGIFTFGATIINVKKSLKDAGDADSIIRFNAALQKTWCIYPIGAVPRPGRLGGRLRIALCSCEVGND